MREESHTDREEANERQYLKEKQKTSTHRTDKMTGIAFGVFSWPEVEKTATSERLNQASRL